LFLNFVNVKYEFFKNTYVTYARDFFQKKALQKNLVSLKVFFFFLNKNVKQRFAKNI